MASPQVIVGRAFFLKKIHLLKVKQQLQRQGYYIEYTRDDFDRLTVYKDRVRYTITQDGIVYARKPLKHLSRDVEELNHFIVEVIYKDILRLHVIDTLISRMMCKKGAEVIIYGSGISTREVNRYFETLGRRKDYRIRGKRLTKHYGGGLAVFPTSTLPQHFCESQILFSGYQNLIPLLLNKHEEIWGEVTHIRTQTSLRLKDLPVLVDQLLDSERQIKHTITQLSQFDHFFRERKQVLEQKNQTGLLKDVKMYDFDEMVNLLSYVKDMWHMNKDYVRATLTLIDSIYKENSQKEMSLLQVIFAVGTIATIVSLGAMPGARLIFENPVGEGLINGRMISFSMPNLFIWSFISVIIGVSAFYFLNKLALGSKKLRIVNIMKRSKERVEH